MANNKTVKQQNREKLDELCETFGDSQFYRMFYDMFDDLSATKQKIYLDWAEQIVQEQWDEMRRKENRRQL